MIEGRGDIAAGNLRPESVSFSDPIVTGVRELVVTGPSAEPIASLHAISTAVLTAKSLKLAAVINSSSRITNWER